MGTQQGRPPSGWTRAPPSATAERVRDGGCVVMCGAELERVRGDAGCGCIAMCGVELERVSADALVAALLCASLTLVLGIVQNVHAT